MNTSSNLEEGEEPGGDDDEFFNEEDEHDDDEDYDDEEEVLIDEMLEKPIDILDEKDEVNFYTYNKIQIKSSDSTHFFHILFFKILSEIYFVAVFLNIDMYWRGCQDTILPEGWVQVTHASGMPLFLNRQTRVCTLSRPYYIGQSSARVRYI